MYSVVLLTVLAASTTAPAHGNIQGGYGAYAPYSTYAWYGCHGGYAPYSSYACYGCRGCQGGYIVPSYGCYGAGFGYHGGCYGAYGVWNGGGTQPYFGSCYGCHGGQSGYGIPLPIPDDKKSDAQPEPFVPSKQPEKKIDQDKEPEVFVPKEKKPAIDKKNGEKPEIKKADGQVRAKVRIDIPPGGRLFVDGHRINGAGSRLFQTPLLTPGQKYFYDIRIEVERNGATVSEQRRVIVEPGIEIAVAFPNLASGTATAQAEE